MNAVSKSVKEIAIVDEFDPASDEDIVKDFEDREMAVEVEKCLKSLPLIYSEALILFYLDEKSHTEISEILRIPMGTVAIRISRAKKLMKKICQKI